MEVEIMKKRELLGFTLTELLTVIVIVAVLAGVLIPLFARSRESARQSTCASNLKQIETALFQYTQDNNGQLVCAWYGGGGFGLSDPNPSAMKYKWMDCIYPYIKNVDVFHCPDSTGWSASGNYIPTNQLPSASDYYYGSYAMNSAYWAQCPRCGPGNHFKLSDVKKPSETIWVADGTGSFQVDWERSNPAPKNLYPGAGQGIGSGNTKTDGESRCNGSIQEVHGGSDLVNILWCDGHLKAMGISDLLQTNKNGDYGAFVIQGPD
jgi:prepilin-type N-terminal cleavage/methylation domain-containing protein/prepilin-type processing-associated H-X9-DG protein